MDLRGLSVVAERAGADRGDAPLLDQGAPAVGGAAAAQGEPVVAPGPGREPGRPAVIGTTLAPAPSASSSDLVLASPAPGSEAGRHEEPGELDEALVPGAGPTGPAWPLGPHYLRWVEGKGVDAWARFKLRAAEWYVEALEVAQREVGLDRFVGVEMAIDGALSSLCAGVDAAGHALVEEVERFAGDVPLRSHRPAGGDWTVLVGLAEGVGIELGSARAIDRAVRGDEEDPEGWLPQLQRLRELAVRRNVLVRCPNVDGSGRDRLLDVPGLGQRPVVRYLRKAGRRADGLVEALLADVDSLARERLRPSRRPGVRRQALPDLAKRADVLGARWHGWEAR